MVRVRNRERHVLRVRLVGVIAATMSAALVLVGCGSTTQQAGDSDSEAQPAANRAEKAWAPATWMGDLFETNDSKTSGKVKLKQLAIPGTHDSQSYVAGDLIVACGARIFHDFTPETTRAWAKTQTDNVYDQARAGVRSFDIRPVVYRKITEWGYDPPWSEVEVPTKWHMAISTCHTAEGATMDELFNSNQGLGRFARENPKEVSIINLNNFNYPTSYYSKEEALDGFVDFVNKNVCKYAIQPGDAGVPSNPGDITLETMWQADRQFVVGADANLFRDLNGKVKCAFELSPAPTAQSLRGGWAKSSKAFKNDDMQRINLWRNEFFGEKSRTPKPDFVRYDDEWANVGPARKYTEFLLGENFERGWPGLSETSYTWVYDNSGLTNGQTYSAASANSLISATWDVLRPNAGEFIRTLDKRAAESGSNVNIVNMDGVKRGAPETHSQFVAPLMEINKRIAPDRPKPASDGYLLQAADPNGHGSQYCVGTSGPARVARGFQVRLVPCEAGLDSVFNIDLRGNWQRFRFKRGGLCVSLDGVQRAWAVPCDESDDRQLLRWHSGARAIQSASDSSRCLDIVHWEMGSDLEFQGCHLGNNQVFTPRDTKWAADDADQRLARSKLFLVVVDDRPFCWKVDSLPLKRGARVALSQCGAKSVGTDPNFLFERVNVGDDNRFKLMHRGMCLDYAKGNPTWQAILWECNGGANQTFTFAAVQGQKDVVVIRPTSDQGRSIRRHIPLDDLAVYFSEGGKGGDEWRMIPPFEVR